LACAPVSCCSCRSVRSFRSRLRRLSTGLLAAVPGGDVDDVGGLDLGDEWVGVLGPLLAAADDGVDLHAESLGGPVSGVMDVGAGRVADDKDVNVVGWCAWFPTIRQRPRPR
jgi:hypothetical protein